MPRIKTKDDPSIKLIEMQAKLKELETRLKLLESEQRGKVDLSEFMAKPELLQPPEDVVETALRGLQHGRSHIISGLPNYLMIQSERLAPRSLIARIAGMALRNAFGDKK